MNITKKFNLYAAGLAIFAMFFGAGNIIFPLALGRHALDQTPSALTGLLLTAVLMPFAGLIAMFLYDGQILKFFGRLGRWPGLLLATLTISLLGPFGAASRCIALAYSTFNVSFSGTNLPLFSAISCLFIFFFTFRKNQILALLGYILSPLKITLLVMIILVGFSTLSGTLPSYDLPSSSHFWHGLKEGYNTMDLLAAFFFAPVILSSLVKKSGIAEGNTNDQALFRFILKASAIGAFLLASVYIGYCFLSAALATQLEGIPNDQLLAAISIKVLGPYAGILVSLTVTIACLTTAIALLAAFAEFFQKEIFRGKIAYPLVLIGTLLLTFFITTLEFKGISQFLGPILEYCYPILILLTGYNLIERLWFRKEAEAQPGLQNAASNNL